MKIPRHARGASTSDDVVFPDADGAIPSNVLLSRTLERILERQSVRRFTMFALGDKWPDRDRRAM